VGSLDHACEPAQTRCRKNRAREPSEDQKKPNGRPVSRINSEAGQTRYLCPESPARCQCGGAGCGRVPDGPGKVAKWQHCLETVCIEFIRYGLCDAPRRKV